MIEFNSEDKRLSKNYQLQIYQLQIVEFSFWAFYFFDVLTYANLIDVNLVLCPRFNWANRLVTSN